MLIRTLTLLISLLLIFAPEARAQLGSVPYTFSAGATISSAQMNTVLSTAYSLALNRTGGTMTGSLTTLGLLPTTDNASDIGSAALSYNEAWFDGTVTVGALTSAGAVSGTTLSVTAITATTLDTGFGANELYDMDQHVLTTSSPTFADITTGSVDRLTSLTANRILYGSATNTEGTHANFTFDGTVFTVGSATQFIQFDGSIFYFYDGDQGFYAYDAGIRQESFSNTANDSAYLEQARWRGTYAAKLIVQNNDYIGGLYTKAYDGSAKRSSGSLRFDVDGTPGASDMPSRFSVWTTPDGAATEAERFRINNAGNVGIGATTTISARLHLISTTEQFRAGYDATNYFSATVSSAGVTTFNGASGTTAYFQFEDETTVLAPAFNVRGTEGNNSVIQMQADESDDSPDRWTLQADESASGNFTIASGAATTTANFNVTNIDDFIVSAGEGADIDLQLRADEGDDANDTWTLTATAANTFSIANAGGASFSMAATGAVTIPYLASSSGTRFVCSTTTGELTDSASACSGTDPDALAVELADLRGQVATLLGQSARWAAGAPTQAPKSPIAIASNALTVPAGQGVGFFFTLGWPNGACDQLNPAANDFVGSYGCLESGPGRSTAAGAGGLFGSNVVLTANGGHNITMVGYEADIQNVSGEGAAVPQAWATNSKVGLGAVLASNGSTSGDGSAGVSVTLNGTDANDRWRYGVEAGGTRAAAFYARKSTIVGDVNPAVAFLNDTDAEVFLRTTGAHTKVLDSQYVDIFGTQDGRIDIAGLNPVMNMYEADQPFDGKFWRYQVAGGDFTIETVNDAYTAAARVLALKRTGEVNIPALAGSGERQVCVQSDGTLTVCVGDRR